MGTPLSDNKRGGEAANRAHKIESVRAEELGAILESLARERSHPGGSEAPSRSSFGKLEPTGGTPLPRDGIARRVEGAFHNWIESHRALDLPSLSDEAISRESIYGERG
jgi:hypothetical protein